MAGATRTPPTEGRRVGVPSPRPKGRGTYGAAHAGVEAWWLSWKSTEMMPYN